MNKKSLFVILFFLITSQSVFAQFNEYGTHFIKNFGKSEYNGEPQNWSVVQDDRGVMYFGNTNYVLEYDGENWDKIQVTDNNSFIRSLNADESGTVYVGTTGEFGYLMPDKKGRMRYHSLSSDINAENLSTIWKIYDKSDTTYFCATDTIYVFKNKKYINKYALDKGGFLSFMVGKELYVGNYYKGLVKLKNDSIIPVKGGEFYKKQDVFTIQNFSKDKLLIGTRYNGLYVYDKYTGESQTITNFNFHSKELNKLLKEAQIYNGKKLSDGNYAFGTLQKGLIIADLRKGEILYNYTDKHLPDPAVTDICESNQGNLWLAVNKGISFVEYSSPIKKFDKSHGLKGITMDIIRYKGDLYAATTVGVFHQKKTQQGFMQFEKLPGINNQARQFSIHTDHKTGEKHLLVGTIEGVYDLTNLKDIKTESHKYTHTLLSSDFHPNKIYLGTKDWFISFIYQDGLILSDKIIHESIRHIVEQDSSILWATSLQKGVFKVCRTDTGYTYTRYDTTKGLPSNRNIKAFKVSGQCYFGTEKGFYVYNDSLDKFVAKDPFGGRYSNVSPNNFQSADNSSFWISYSKNEEYFVEKNMMKGKNIIFYSKPFLEIPNHTITSIYDDKDDMTWFTTPDGIFSYDNKHKKDYLSYNTLIRKVSLTNDSSIFYGTNYNDTSDLQVSTEQPNFLKCDLDYKFNNIHFIYTAPYYEGESKVTYSYKLEGYDEEWSSWLEKNDKGYTNLNEGHYVFKVKAKNIYGVESKLARYEFTILPPWYRTIWAYIIYIFLGITFIILIVKWYTRRLEKEKIRLEKIVQERTKEVVAQKEQIEHQRDEIVKKNRDITDSIEYASKIQNAVLPDDEYTEEILPEHFILYRPRDIVSGDFYWINKKDDLLIIIAADCTGHGVPGAFMSMLGVSLLNEIVNKHPVTKANDILTELREEVKRTLKQRGAEGETKDGMDIALAMVDLKNMKLQFAGAYNPLYLFRDGELIQYKADRMPIGIYVKEKPEFTNHIIDLKKGDTFYVFSDGYQDQFGGEKGEKFKTKRMKKLLADIQPKPMEEQKAILERTIDDWKGDREQLDDIILIGVRV